MPVKKSHKIEAQVVEAIRRLQAVQGSTPQEICSHISQEYNLPATEVRRQVQIALKRGVAYGILQRSAGGCYTYNQDFLEKNTMNSGDSGVEMPGHRRGRRRRRSRRSSRRRRRSRRKSRRRGSRRRRSRRRRRAEVPKEIDGLQEKTLAKQPKRGNTLLRKESPQSNTSSLSGCNEERKTSKRDFTMD